jgi:pimeloyl-ACP methyl ester carboxylesterase
MVAGAEPRQLQWSTGELTVNLGMDEVGAGASVVLLPALSSIGTRGEMRGLLERLASHYLVRSVDWPGFGDQPRPRVDWSPVLLSAYLEWLLNELTPPHALIAAGHAAGYALQLCATRPGLIRRLVLIAPTWRGPLPTMMGGQRPWFARLRALLDNRVLGPSLYRLNVSRAVIGLMAREHVYETPRWLQGPRLAAKLAVTRAVGARYASVRFVSGALDPVASRAAFLELARRAAVPILQVYGAQTPLRSCAEMQALAQLPEVRSLCLPHGRLAVHEEFPEQVAAAVLPFLQQGDAVN